MNAKDLLEFVPKVIFVHQNRTSCTKIVDIAGKGIAKNILLKHFPHVWRHVDAQQRKILFLVFEISVVTFFNMMCT